MTDEKLKDYPACNCPRPDSSLVAINTRNRSNQAAEQNTQICSGVGLQLPLVVRGYLPTAEKRMDQELNLVLSESCSLTVELHVRLVAQQRTGRPCTGCL